MTDKPRVAPPTNRELVIELFDEVGCGLAALELLAEEGQVAKELDCRIMLRKLSKLREMLVPNAPEEPMMKDHFPDAGVAKCAAAAAVPPEPTPVGAHTPFPWIVRQNPASDDPNDCIVESPRRAGHAFGQEILGAEAYPTKRADAELIAKLADSRTPAEADHIANPGKMMPVEAVEALKRDVPL